MKKIGFKINNKTISENSKPLIIAEIAQAHDGSLGYAFSFINLASKCGADAVKFQAHYAEEETTLDEPFRKKFITKFKNRYEYWKNMEFTKAEWKSLFKYAKSKKLLFIVSTFSEKSFNLMKEIKIDAIKIPSGEFINLRNNDYILNSKMPLIFSTGMSDFKDIKLIDTILKRKKSNYSIMHCTSKYPTPLKDVGINNILILKKNLNCIIGLSDHSGSPYPSIYALSNGAKLIEVHLCFHKDQFGPDTSSSLDPYQFKNLVTANNEFHILSSNKVKKIEDDKELLQNKKIFSKSLCLVKNFSKGTIIKKNMLTLKKPGNGIPFKNMDKVLGKKLKKNVSSKKLLKYSDF